MVSVPAVSGSIDPTWKISKFDFWVLKREESEGKVAHLRPVLAGFFEAPGSSFLSLLELTREGLWSPLWANNLYGLLPLPTFRSSSRKPPLWSPEEEAQLQEL